MKRIVLFMASLLGLAASTGITIAADDAAPANGATADARSADDAAIRAAGAAFTEAYNAGDAKKLAALWSPDAVYIDPLTGEQTVGRDAIEKVFADAFADKQRRQTVDRRLTSIEFVSPNVAIVRGVAHVIRPGEEPRDSDFTSVRVKQDGKWLIDRVTRGRKGKSTHPSNYEHLKEFAVDDRLLARRRSAARRSKSKPIVPGRRTRTS